MVSFKKNSILTLLFLNKFFVLAYQPADSLSLIEEKLLNYNEIPISLKQLLCQNNQIEYLPELPETLENLLWDNNNFSNEVNEILSDINLTLKDKIIKLKEKRLFQCKNDFIIK